MSRVLWTVELLIPEWPRFTSWWPSHYYGGTKWVAPLARDGFVEGRSTPVPRSNYRIGVPRGGFWKEVFNSDAKEYAGSGMGNGGGVMAEATSSHGQPFSLNLTLPPLAVVFLRN